MAKKLALVAIPMGLLLNLAAAPAAQGQCRLCIKEDEKAAAVQQEKAKQRIPLRIDIMADLNFSRLALANRGGGTVSVDAHSGHRRISGGLIDLGGSALKGSALVTGEPGENVRITLPRQIEMNAPDGAVAVVTKLETDLPPQAQLNSNGELRFAFGGKLNVTGSSTGRFRGRIAITAEYE